MRASTVLFGLHALAIASSAVHSVADAALISVMSLPAALIYVALGFAAFTWWVFSLSRLVKTGLRSGAWGAASMALVWGALANGATIGSCMPPCAAGAWADVVHIGSLVFGFSAAVIAAWIALRGTPRPASNPGA